MGQHRVEGIGAELVKSLIGLIILAALLIILVAIVKADDPITAPVKLSDLRSKELEIIDLKQKLTQAQLDTAKKDQKIAELQSQVQQFESQTWGAQVCNEAKIALADCRINGENKTVFSVKAPVPSQAKKEGE